MLCLNFKESHLWYVSGQEQKIDQIRSDTDSAFNAILNLLYGYFIVCCTAAFGFSFWQVHHFSLPPSDDNLLLAHKTPYQAVEINCTIKNWTGE